MAFVLRIIAVLTYLFAALAFMTAFAGVGASNIGLIVAGIYVTCGTVALAGASIVDKLDELIKGPQPKKEYFA